MRLNLGFNLDKILSDIAYIAIGGVTLAIISVESWLLPYVKEFQMLKSDGKILQFPDSLNNLIKETINDLKLSNKKKERLKFYLSERNYLHHNGGFHLHEGAIIGIPYWFTYNSLMDVKIDDISLNSQINLNLEEPETLKFCHSLILSKNAKKFALAKEAYSVDFGDAYVKIFTPTLAGLIPLALCTALMERFEISAYPYYKLSLYFLTILFALIFYITIKDITYEYVGEYATKRAANINNGYAEGGLEYYNKHIILKKALEAISTSDKVKDKFFSDNYPLNRIKLIEKIINDKKELQKELH